VVEQDLQEQGVIKIPPAKVRAACMAAAHFAPDSLTNQELL
jgi:hypothetical protein